MNARRGRRVFPARELFIAGFLITAAAVMRNRFQTREGDRLPTIIL